MLRSKEPEQIIATVPAGETLQDWRDQDLQIEQQAQRLDRIRTVLSRISPDSNSWKSQYWRTAEAQVLSRWKLMDHMRVAGVRTDYQKISPVDHSWLEPDDPGAGGGDKPWSWNLEQQLERSWEKAREAQLQKARLGQA